jgi:hypothetical protein
MLLQLSVSEDSSYVSSEPTAGVLFRRADGLGQCRAVMPGGTDSIAAAQVTLAGPCRKKWRLGSSLCWHYAHNIIS